MPTFYSIGFFGTPNLGDELLAAMVTEALQAEYPGCTTYVMTRSARVSADYGGLRTGFVEGAVPTPEYLQNLHRHIRVASRADLVLVGGGGLIADHYSWAAIPSYFVDVCWAILGSRPYVFVGLGVVGVRRRWLRPLARFICRHARAAYCRDEKSAEQLAQLGSRADVRVGPDLGNLVLGQLAAPCAPGNYALVNFRERPPLDEQRIGALCHELIQHTGELVLLSAETPDSDYYRRVVSHWPAEAQAATRIVEPDSLAAAIRLIREARVIAAERLHVNVLAVHAARPLLTLDYEEKVGEFVSAAGGGLICSLDEISAEHARRLLALEVPRRTDRLEELARGAREAFSQTVKAGLEERGQYSPLTKAGALFHLLFILVITAVWAALTVVKRLLFGRGPFRRIPAIGRR